MRIFSNADKVDCAGRADANTSKAYYAASFFLEVRYPRQIGDDVSNIAGSEVQYIVLH